MSGWQWMGAAVLCLVTAAATFGLAARLIDRPDPPVKDLDGKVRRPWRSL